MILVRDIFRFKFGQAKEPIGLWKQVIARMRQSGWKARLMTDLVGPDYYSLILESTWDSLADWEKQSSALRADPQWRVIYEKILPYTESGRREVLSLID
jgi:NIPSNAP protein